MPFVSQVSLRLFDIAGRMVATLFEDHQPLGTTTPGHIQRHMNRFLYFHTFALSHFHTNYHLR